MVIVIVVGLLVAGVGVLLALGRGPQPIEGSALPAPGAATAGTRPALVVHVYIYRGGALVRSEQVARDVIKIGTDARSHVRLEGTGVNRLHAVIEAAGPDAVRLIDLGSREGTVLNGERIHTAALRHGDVIVLGDLRLVVGLDAPPPRTVGAS